VKPKRQEPVKTRETNFSLIQNPNRIMKAIQLKSALAALALVATTAVSAETVFGPVELSPFDTHIELKWTTMHENQMSHFVVLRSFNSIDWFEIGTLPAAGNSSDPIDYLFVDGQPLPGKNYYVVIGVDSQGVEMSGPVLYHDYDPMTVCDFVVFPNPADDYLLLYWEECVPLQWAYSIRSEFGFTTQAEAPLESSFVQLDVSDLAPGMYLITVTRRGYKQKITRLVYII